MQIETPSTRLVRNWRLALIAVLALFSLHIALTDRVRKPIGDNYEKFAYALAEWGVFGVPRDSKTEPPAGIGRAPLYPAFLAGIMLIDPHDKARGACFVDNDKDCAIVGGTTPFVQLALVAASLLLVYEIALLFGAAPLAAALASMAVAPPLLRFMFQFQISEALAVPLFGIASYGLARWYRGISGLGAVAVAGAALGLLCLTRVAYDVFVPVAALALIAIPVAGNAQPVKRRIAAALVLVAAYGAVLSPWIARNAATTGEFISSDQGVPGVLAMRAVYNRMTAEEALIGSVHFLPGFGPGLARKLFPEEITAKFDFENPVGFREQGWALLAQRTAEYPDRGERTRALVGDMFASPAGHLLATIPLTIDGVHHVFWLIPFAAVGLVVALRSGAWWIAGAVVLTLFNLVFHSAITHFRSRYGMPMAMGVGPLAALGVTYLARSYLPNAVQDRLRPYTG